MYSGTSQLRLGKGDLKLIDLNTEATVLPVPTTMDPIIFSYVKLFGTDHL